MSEFNAVIDITVSHTGGSTRETELMRSLQLLLDKLSRGENPMMQQSFAQKGSDVNILLGDIQVRLLLRLFGATMS